MTGRDGTTAVIGAMARLLQSFDDTLVAEFMTAWPATQPLRPLRPNSLPVLAWLEPACDAGPASAAEFLRHLRGVSPVLAWAQTYTAADFGPAFLERYGWTEFVGQRGLVPSERLAAGLLLLGPGVTYPSHSHDAEELYIPLSGRADWQRGAEGWRERVPGEVIHHPSKMPHAMRTAGEPLLAVYLWRGGDLVQRSRIE